MAITKIMCMKSAEHGNAAAHLKHSLAYICNEAKTEKGSISIGGGLKTYLYVINVTLSIENSFSVKAE